MSRLVQSLGVMRPGATARGIAKALGCTTSAASAALCRLVRMDLAYRYDTDGVRWRYRRTQRGVWYEKKAQSNRADERKTEK